MDNVDTIVIDVDNKNGIREKYETDIVCYNGVLDSKALLGTYSSEEKAIKVLDMIENACRNSAFIDETAVVFRMPQDREVIA